VDVILLQDVEKVGLKGEVVNVARGYARNFLMPRRLAEPATPGRLAELQRHQELRARHEAQTVEQAQETASALEGTELRFDVKAGPTGSLFGSVTATDIADELWTGKRIRVDRKKIGLDDSIKRIGRYDVPVELFTDVTVDVRVLVVPEGGELPPEEEPAAEAVPEAEAASEAEAAPEAEAVPEAEAEEAAPELEARAEAEAEAEPAPAE
jgi:large subunit ribosomal protein L9